MNLLPEDNLILPGIKVPPAALQWKFSRSSGPGGQNVNKLNTRVELVVDLGMLEPGLPRAMVYRLKEILEIEELAGKTVRFVSESGRTQLVNRQNCIEKLRALLRRAQIRPKKRIATRKPRAVNEKRLERKKQNSQRKQNRRWRGERE